MPSRSPSAAALLLLAAAGCASRSPEVSDATRDQRRQEIARLDQRIATAELELGLRRPTYTAVPETQDAVTGVDGGGAAAGQAIQPAQPAPPDEPVQASPPPPMAPAQEPPTMAGNQTRAEPGAAGGTCARVCRSVAAICEASSRICRLADDLDDAWASGRCEASTRSCDAAERRAESSCGGC